MTNGGGEGGAPLRFRRRLTVAFVAIAGVAAGTLSIGSYLVVESQRYSYFEKRSVGQMEASLALVRASPDADVLEGLKQVASESPGFAILVVTDTAVSTMPQIGPDDIPRGLHAEPGEYDTARTMAAGQHFLVIASELPNTTPAADVYFWFSLESVRDNLRELRSVLLGGCLVVTGLAFLVGRAIAIRTLAPIHLAADAARQRAEGLLHTQLEVPKSDEFRAWANYFDDVAGALETKIQELSAAHERERRFTADVAHDLRTPLSAMVSASSILAEYLDEMPEGARRPTQLIVNDVSRLRRLVTDLLEIGRLDSQKEPPNIEPIDVEALLQGVVMSVAREAEVSLEIQGASRIQSDRVRLERVLANVIENAFIHGGGDVTVRANASDEKFVVEICDQGPGIPEDQLPHIFDRFHKASASRTSAGSGLGLAIASQHVAILGGALTAMNGDGGGTCFRIDLPISSNPK